MKQKIKILTLGSVLFFSSLLITGCSGSKTVKFQKPDIKDDYCGVVMNYQYCKCAFHDEFCDQIGLSSSAANVYVRDEYDKWLTEQKKSFGQDCEAQGGIYNGDDSCQYCEAPYYKEGKQCVKSEEVKEQVSDLTGFKPEGPFNAGCTINEDLFENDWKKYSDFDNNIAFESRSWEVQQGLGVYEQIIKLKTENFILERDMEIDRQLRLAMRDYKTALVQNIKTNLLKSFWRLSYVTYSTIRSGQGVGTSYSTVLTSANNLEVISNGLKVVQAVIPSDSSLAIDTSTAAGKVKSMGVNAALEAFDSLGDPVKIATQVFTDATSAALPSADITPEEIEILRTQHLNNQEIDKALQASYQANALRRATLLANQQQIQVLEVEVASWEGKEKARVRSMLEADCLRQQADFENEETSFINKVINKVYAQEDVQVYNFGDYSLEYNTEETIETGSKNYYKDNNLVLSADDTNGDGQIDLWLQYDNELYLILEAHDTTGDGQPDTIIELDQAEQVTNLIQPKVGDSKVAEISNDNQNIVVVEEDNNNPFKLFLAIIVVISLGIFIYLKNGKKKSN